MESKRWIVWMGGILAVGAAAIGGWAARPRPELPDAPVYTRTFLSQTYDVDRKYRSMKGPSSAQDLHLGTGDKPELLWITGYEAVMVGADGETPMPQEFMCHSNLDIDPTAHGRVVAATGSYSPRLFTLSQGQFAVHFPRGFGIPVRSDEELSLTTQVLNLNLEGKDVQVRHKVTVDYVRDADTGGAMKALYPTAAYGLVLLEGDQGYFGVPKPDEVEHGPGCLVGQNASDHTYTDGFHRTFSGHWVVKPGREVNRTLVTKLMALPYDTTLHYVAVHLHPFAESLELRDLTANQTVFASRAENYPDKIGLARVESFSSEEGVPLYADHEYELVSVYNNTTDEDQDSMAVMYLYVLDKTFDEKYAEGSAFNPY